jgi:uncharacterized protein
MTKRDIEGKQILLRLYIGELDHFDRGGPLGKVGLYQEIMERAFKMGIAGCTVFRAVTGYGASSIVHKTHLFSSDAPLVVEVVDSNEHIQKFIREIKPILSGALVTEHQVTVHRYSAKE